MLAGYQAQGQAQGQALATAGRPIVYSMCNGYDAAVQPQTWAGSVSNLWRTTRDIRDSYASMVSIVNTDDQYAADAAPVAETIPTCRRWATGR